MATVKQIDSGYYGIQITPDEEKLMNAFSPDHTGDCLEKMVNSMLNAIREGIQQANEESLRNNFTVIEGGKKDEE